jgi:hypothetical protein
LLARHPPSIVWPMRLRRLGFALVVVIALGAAMASSALATAVTEDVQWKVEGATLTGSEFVKSTGSAETVTAVGGAVLVIKATGINCIGCQITNSGGTAVGSGELEYTGVTVVVPSTCAVSGGVIRTKPLRIKADYMESTADYWLFEPAGGPTFSTVTLTRGLGACPITGSYIKSGTVFGKANNVTGTLASSQTISFSGSINNAAGGATQFGGKPAELNGSLTLSMAGARAGKKFGTS